MSSNPLQPHSPFPRPVRLLHGKRLNKQTDQDTPSEGLLLDEREDIFTPYPEVLVRTRNTAETRAIKPISLYEDDIADRATLILPAISGVGALPEIPNTPSFADIATLPETPVPPLPISSPSTTSATPTNAATSTNYTIYSSTRQAQSLEKKRLIEEKRLSVRDLLHFLHFITPFKWQIVLSLILTVGVGLTALPLPFIFHVMLDQVFPQKDVPLFMWSLALLLAVFILEQLLIFSNRTVIGSLSRAANLNIIYRFYRHMLRLPLSYYQGATGTGQSLSRLNEVTSAQQTVLQMIIDIAVNTILTLIYAGVLFLTDWRMTLVVIGVAPFYLGVNLYFNRKTRRVSRQVLESYARLNGMMYEGLTGLKTIKALVAEHRFGRTVKKVIMQTNQLSFQRTVYQSKANLVVGIVQSIGVIIILTFGGYLVLIRAMTAGQLAAYVLILRELATPVSTLSGINQQLQAAAVAIDRLFEILNQPIEDDTEQKVSLPEVQGHVSFEQVRFSYTPEVEVLHDLSLNVPPGTTIALVGRSGAGKTTIANLLMRFYDPDSGRILLDGHDLRDLSTEQLRSHFGVILQDDSLFSGTIEENLSFGLLRKVSRAEMREAARNANILDFIDSMPLGFQTILKERGQSLSNGQRQRISIARMFLHQPKILVMDEPSSALDNESEALIQQALKRLTAGRTTFIIAHRLSTIRDADRIVIIDNGRIAEQGTHDELLERQGVYWQLYNSYGRV